MKTTKLFELIDNAEKIVFFGGAGVSTSSGIPDFRGTGGLYHEKYDYPPEIILSSTFFWRHTEEFYRFYYDKMIYPEVKPNYCHKALAYLEEKGKLIGVVTQNIDGLHQLAGSKKVYELHGSVYRNYSVNTNRFYSLDYMLSKKGDPLPLTEDGELIKPDVVLYEEPLNSEVMRQAIDVIGEADLLIVGGTSLTVYPAAGLIHYFGGNDVIVINKAPLMYRLDTQINMDINEFFEKYLEHIGVDL